MRWDDRPLWERIRAEARSRQIDLSKYITMKEACSILGLTRNSVRAKYDWLEGVMLCGHQFVKRDRTVWLSKRRAGTLPPSDMMGESLGSYDVNAYKAELQRVKDEEEEARRRKEEAERPKGLHVEGKCWVDYDSNDTWITTDDALRVLGCRMTNLFRLGRRGRIRSRWAEYRTYQPVDVTKFQLDGFGRYAGDSPGQQSGEQPPARHRLRHMWSLRDIDSYCDWRDSRGRLRGKSQNDPDRPFILTRIYDLENAAHERKLISLQEAADVLRVGSRRVSDLVTAGRLKAYKQKYGPLGGRVWLSEDDVVAHANNPERLARKERWQLYRMAKDLDPKWEKKPRKESPSLWYHADRLDGSHPVDHREDYTLPEAARVLGCSVDTVRRKVKNGILPGFKKARQPQDRWNERRWWFIKKDDVHAYKGSLEYKRRRWAYLKPFISWISNEPRFKT